jgi:protein-tyrosine-phosphatase
MAEALLRAELGGRAEDVEVGSAGFLKKGTGADINAIWALNKLGIDVSSHRSTTIASALAEHPDLILVMAREHLRFLTRLESGVLERAFTLKEFNHLGDIEGGRCLAETLEAYLKRVHASRRNLAIMSPTREEDVDDPIGRSKKSFARCAYELRSLVRQTVDLLYPVSDEPRRVGTLPTFGG